MIPNGTENMFATTACRMSGGASIYWQLSAAYRDQIHTQRRSIL